MFLCTMCRETDKFNCYGANFRSSKNKYWRLGEFSEKFLEGNLKKFDVIVSFSSLEHSGLGRYGDGLNPWADLMAMAKAWCVVKPDGLALVGVPAGEDMIQV